MAQESPFVDVALSVAEKIFCRPIRVVRGAPLLYEITVNNSLEVMTQEQIRHPKRGASAFQTDLCILEEKSPDVTIPRVVLEFKTKITTHDILTYSAKATKHKQIYPYLRYGIIASEERKVPRRFFTHNDGLDFFVSVAGLDGNSFEKFLEKFLVAEIASSQRLEEIAFGSTETRVFRNEVELW
ncbi:MAG: hypothetical protein IPL29_10395 [Propionivibrio sp.]|nr:hypothetical protein [Propionivibrio sp.]